MQTNFTRGDGRLYNQLRNLSMERNFLAFAEGSCLVSFGRTKVICTASIEDKVPSFLAGSKQGWITAEYGMLPKSTKERMNRDRGFNGRNQEIQRLIGRSLRCVTNLDKLGERTIYIDCDVIQADGGTRTAAISGAMVALHDALSFLKTNNLISEWPIKEMAAAVSVGIVDGRVCLDLDYSEDSVADVDFNVVQTESGQYVELQGTAEHHTFSNPQLLDLLTVAGEGIQQIVGFQKSVLGIV